MQSMVNLSTYLVKATNPASRWFLKNYNSWALALRNASSPNEALDAYSQMHRLSIKIYSSSIVVTLKSCRPLKDNRIIHHLHAHILKLGFRYDVFVATSLIQAYFAVSARDAHQVFDEMPDKSIVTWNAMISGYSRFGDLKTARMVFDEMPERNVVSWCAMITAYVNNGDPKRGLSLFRRMVMVEGLQPDHITAVTVLSGCGYMGTQGLRLGKLVHGFVAINGWELTVELGTALVDMYAKCGFVEGAARVFELVQEKNVMAWNAIIRGLAKNNCCKSALYLFDEMQKAGVRPNEPTLNEVLSACVHGGLLVEGHKCFKLIQQCDLKPRIQHYRSMVQLYGNAGLLEEAYDVIKNMKLEPDVLIWRLLLSACKYHKQFEMAERVVVPLMKTLPLNRNGGRLYSLISDLMYLKNSSVKYNSERYLFCRENGRKAEGLNFDKPRSTTDCGIFGAVFGKLKNAS